MSEAAEVSKTVSVAIIDDHAVLVDGLAMVISSQSDLRWVGSAGTGAAGCVLLEQQCPDVLLVDVVLPDWDGIDLIPELSRRCPETNILVLTSLSDEDTLLRAIDTGVSGFVGKNRPASEVLSAIRKAAEGEIILPSSLLLGLLARVSQPRGRPENDHPWEPLTARETEVLQHLAQGRSATAITAELSIAYMTVRTHIRNLMAKLGVHSRLEAVAFALRHGLIEPPI